MGQVCGMCTDARDAPAELKTPGSHRKERLLRIFASIDRAHRGRIDKKEVCRFAKAMAISDEKIAELWTALDYNRDGGRSPKKWTRPATRDAALSPTDV